MNVKDGEGMREKRKEERETGIKPLQVLSFPFLSHPMPLQFPQKTCITTLINQSRQSRL